MDEDHGTVELRSKRMQAVPWEAHQTAYGPAIAVPGQLLRLAGQDEKTALAASHDLWCSLCQHVYAAPAAVPALPFILEVLSTASEKLTIAILDILLGFVSCTLPDESARPAWLAELRIGVASERPRLELLSTHANSELAELACDLLKELDSPQSC